MRKLLTALFRWFRVNFEALAEMEPEHLNDDGYYAMLGHDGYYGA